MENFPKLRRPVARMWFQATSLNACMRAAALIVQVEATAWDARVVIKLLWRESLMEVIKVLDGHKGTDGVIKVLEVLQDYFLPHAADTAYQSVAHFSHFCKSAQTLGENFVKFDLLRRKAEGRTHQDGTFPDARVATLCLQNMSLPNRAKSLSPAINHGELATMGIAQQMRRLFGPLSAPPRGGGSRRRKIVRRLPRPHWASGVRNRALPIGRLKNLKDRNLASHPRKAKETCLAPHGCLFRGQESRTANRKAKKT